MLKVTLRALAVLLLIGAMSSLIYGLYVREQPEYDAYLNIAFVGTAADADCIVLWQKDFAMMIDTGEDRDEKAILAFLSEKQITKLNYLVLTHPDKDHIGSASAIIHALKVDTVIEPYYQRENDTYRYLQARLAQNHVRVVVPARVLHYIVNDMNIYIYPPLEKSYNNNNNYSLAVFIQHRDVDMVFPGDAENKRLMELMQQVRNAAKLYKLPNHGRYSERSNVFFALLRPLYTVVTAGSADQRMTETGAEWGTEWYFAEKHTVAFQSNGETLQVVPQL